MAHLTVVLISHAHFFSNLWTTALSSVSFKRSLSLTPFPFHLRGNGLKVTALLTQSESNRSRAHTHTRQVFIKRVLQWCRSVAHPFSLSLFLCLSFSLTHMHIQTNVTYIRARQSSFFIHSAFEWNHEASCIALLWVMKNVAFWILALMSYNLWIVLTNGSMSELV